MPKHKDKRPAIRKSARDEWMKEMYEKARRDFTAADLQRFTVIEKGIPMEQVIAECAEINRKTKRKRA